MIQPTAQHSAPQPALFFPFRWSPAEREVWKAKEDLRASQWVEKYLHVPRGAHVGQYRNEYNPYGVDIMDTFEQPHVREVNVCAPPQATKTITAHCCLAKSIVYDPCEMMIVMPAREEVREEMDDRIIPMLQQSPELAKCLSDNPDDTSKYHIKLNNGAIIYTAWATSASKLARKAIKKMFFDETDKYPDMVGKETDPFNLGEKRKRTFKHTYKIYRSSTPTLETGPIWRFLHRSDVIKAWCVYCPDCGGAQIMYRKKGLRYPEGKTPEDIQLEKLGRYECEHCKSLWTDSKRDQATRAGHYIVTKGEKISHPRSVGYHLNGCAVTDISLSEIAAKEVQAKTDTAAAIDLANDYDAEPYIVEKSQRKEAAILKLRDEHLPRGVVPRDSSALLMLVDTQQVGFHYSFVAFGYGIPLQPTVVDHGFAPDFNSIKLLSQRQFQTEGTEQTTRALAGFIDSGGGTNPQRPKSSRTREVYDFCILNPFFRPLKGARTMSTAWNSTMLEYYPGNDGKKIPLPGILDLYRINVTIFKDELAGKININPGDPGCLRLHAGTEEEFKGFASQLCSEYRDERGFWICPNGKENHHWDIMVYALAAAEILQIKLLQPPEDIQPEAPADEYEGKRNHTRGGLW